MALAIPAHPAWSVYTAIWDVKIDISRAYDTHEEAEAFRQKWLAENHGTAVVLPHVSWSTAIEKR
jgi:hypothetical protein